MRVSLRQLAIFALTAACPALAAAIGATYEGQLIPMRTNDSPISIVVQVEEVAGFLSGTISTSSPLRYTSTINAGRNVAGYCNMATALSSNMTLRLYGECGRTAFDGKYAIYYNQPKRITRGTFRLTRKIVDTGRGSGSSEGETSASLIIACTKANARCLTGCPRGDTDVESLCVNHCRTKLQACKGKVSKLADVPE